jgi:MFS family permease
MPLGMAAAWSWARMLGTSEWALRAPNMVYAVGAILCFYLIGRRERIPLMPLFLAVQPFLWFYVNEARPYALQIFGGSLLLLSFYDTYRGNLSSPRWALLWAVGALISVASSMLGAIPTFAVTIAITAELYRRRFWPNRRQLFALIAGALPMLGLGGYFVSTLLAGAGGAKIWSVGPQNLLLSAIEFLGLAGMLPARHELRELVREGLAQPGMWVFAMSASAMLGLYLITCAYWILHRKLTPRWVSVCLTIVVGSAGLLFAASMVVGFPFWGRHLAVTFPFFIAAACWIVCIAWRGTSLLARASSIGLVFALLTSSLMLRFSTIHVRDDYKTATEIALESFSQGKVIWWAADRSAARYYGLKVGHKPNALPDSKEKTAILDARNLTAQQASFAAGNHVIILSKPDLYDSGMALRELIRKKEYSLTKKLASFYIYNFSGKILGSGVMGNYPCFHSLDV